MTDTNPWNLSTDQAETMAVEALAVIAGTFPATLDFYDRAWTLTLAAVDLCRSRLGESDVIASPVPWPMNAEHQAEFDALVAHIPPARRPRTLPLRDARGRTDV